MIVWIEWNHKQYILLKYIFKYKWQFLASWSSVFLALSIKLFFIWIFIIKYLNHCFHSTMNHHILYFLSKVFKYLYPTVNYHFFIEDLFLIMDERRKESYRGRRLWLLFSQYNLFTIHWGQFHYYSGRTLWLLFTEDTLITIHWGQFYYYPLRKILLLSYEDH